MVKQAQSCVWNGAACHRIAARLGLEGTLKTVGFQCPATGRGTSHRAGGALGSLGEGTLWVRSSSGCSWSSTPTATGGCAHICLAPCLLLSCCDGLMRYFMSWAVFLLWWWWFLFFCDFFFFLIEGMCEFLV